MTFFQSIILGIVEGLTEFLPISSTFHLIFSSRLLRIPSDDFVKLFEVFIQSGAILSVVFIYLQKVLHNINLSRNIILSFIPTAIIGFLLQKTIKNVFFESNTLMIIAFVLVGFVFLLIEKLIRENKIIINKTLDKITPAQALLVGVFQAFAVIPGVSRSGAVMIGLLFLGFNRSEAAEYSFLLAVPTIFAASALDLIKTPRGVLTTNHIDLLIVGFLVSFISAYLAIRWFIGYLKRHSLTPFAFYRFILAALLIL